MTKKDDINHPEHYKAGALEAIDVIEALDLGEGFCKGNAIKYLMRAGKKEDQARAKDIRKAIWYLMRLIREAEVGEYLDLEADVRTMRNGTQPGSDEAETFNAIASWLGFDLDEHPDAAELEVRMRKEKEVIRQANMRLGPGIFTRSKD